MTTITATFEIDRWDQETYDDNGPALARASIQKTYAGDLVGVGTAELLMCEQAGYLANERFVGSLGDRSGSFVLQHGGIGEEPFGAIVPGSGTGDLTGLSGTVRFAHLRVELDVDG